MEASFTFKAYSESIIISINGEAELLKFFINDFLELFQGAIDFENRKISNLHNTSDLRNRVNDFVKRNGAQLPQLNVLPSYFNKLKSDEVFLIIPSFLKLDQSEAMRLHLNLASIEEKLNLDDLNSKFDALFKDLLKKYEVRVFKGDERICIGEKDKDKRKCRFCSKSIPAVKFNKKAHAISESLGNKNVILYDECDDCNLKFSKDYEPDITTYFSIFRTLYDVKGKNGSKKPRIKNGKFEKDEFHERKFVIEYNSNEKDDNLKLPFNIPLEMKDKITPQNIYKILCKYFISVIDPFYLTSFQKTIDWINGNYTIEQLPKIAKLLIFSKKLETIPVLTIYLRKSEDSDMPFAIGEFKFVFIHLIFIVPFNSNDDLDYLDEKIYLEQFWLHFLHFHIAHSSFDDFSFNRATKFTFNFKIENDDE